MLISIVVPTYQEAGAIAATLRALAGQPGPLEVIVVDGGSPDDTRAVVEAVAAELPYPVHVDSLVPGGRARQLNHGASLAKGEALLFLHADTLLPPDGLACVREALGASGSLGGRFDVGFDDPAWEFAVIAVAINARTRLTGLFTGDMAIFLSRRAFDELGGYADMQLMEDLDLSRRLGRLGPVVALGSRVITSARRWRKRGIWRTVLLMQALRAAYALGVSPVRLARWYRHVR